jgi:hypothetical protein
MPILKRPQVKRVVKNTKFIEGWLGPGRMDKEITPFTVIRGWNTYRYAEVGCL